MEVRDSVVVITGGSSGIGRCTALMLAKHGTKLVLASRNKRALNEVAKECKRAGGEAIVVECDVTEESDVLEVAENAVEEFGRIDVWINNAGVGVYGRFEDVPSDTFRKVVETHLFGVANGARAALRQFREQGSRGILIDVSSQVATGGIPYMTAYGAAKYGIRMFDDTLRQELVDSPEIHVCTVLPSSTDTPFFQHAANYTGRGIKPVGAISPPEAVAEEIVDLIREPQRQVYIGKHGYAMGAAHALVPNLYNRVIRKKADQDHFENRRASHADGNVFAPTSPEQLYGGWKKGSGGKASAILSLAGAAVLGIWWARQARTHGGTWGREAA